ncbi:MAG: hypothetical protein ABI615_13220 [Chthoniobacterales bacterium]
MAASETSICNLALGRLGNESILSTDDDSESARVCKLFYEPTRDEVLRAHRWKFATVLASLARLTTAPAFGWACQYQLPTEPEAEEWMEITDPAERQMQFDRMYSDINTLGGTIDPQDEFFLYSKHPMEEKAAVANTAMLADHFQVTSDYIGNEMYPAWQRQFSMEVFGKEAESEVQMYEWIAERRNQQTTLEKLIGRNPFDPREELSALQIAAEATKSVGRFH